MMKSNRDFEQRFTRDILFREPDPAAPADMERYFGPLRFPGTTSIGYRRLRPEIFQDTLNSRLETYPEWLKAQVMRTVGAVRHVRSGAAINTAPGDRPVQETVEAVEKILGYPTDSGRLLADDIPQQMYEDVFVRIVLSLTQSPGYAQEPHLYKNCNALCHRIGMVLLTALKDRGARAEIKDILSVSVLSGHIGINLKSSASAASSLLNRNRIPLSERWVTTPAAVRAVSRADLYALSRRVLDMADSAEGRFELTSLDDYYREVVDTVQPTLVVFFCDDYLESIIDLKRFEVMLSRNPFLRVLFIPRAGRYGNDLAFSDVAAVFREPHFNTLRRFGREGRFHVSPHGPRAGCIDIRDMSRRLIDEIDMLGADHQVVIETKGCRNFEMLRGRLPLPWYASFNCNRALSIRTVGVDGPPVFLRVPPGLDAYDGFTRPVIAPSQSYPETGVRFARMTTLQLYNALNTRAYQALRHQLDNEFTINEFLMEHCRQREMTFSELFQCPESYTPTLFHLAAR